MRSYPCGEGAGAGWEGWHSAEGTVVSICSCMKGSVMCGKSVEGCRKCMLGVSISEGALNVTLRS